MKKIRCIFAFTLFAFSITGFAAPAIAHEFWLEPAGFQAKTGETIEVSLRNGQKFSGGKLGYFQDRIVLFDWLQNGVRKSVKSRTGDFPALRMTVENDGLMVLVYQSTASVIKYKNWEKFAGFVKHKGFSNAKEHHQQRGFPEQDFGEIYTRFGKTLIGIGAAGGHDKITGLLTEFVALSNPYTDDLTQGFAVKLLFEGAPRRYAQIEVFERPADGPVKISTLITDDQGHALIPVKAGHSYLLDAVILREPTAELAKKHDVVWESLWASLTFMVPK